MSQQLIELQKRIGNATLQTRCDRRTIATLTQHFAKEHPISSMGQVIRLALEFCERAILSEWPELELLSVEDADEYLSKMFDKYNPNPGRRGLMIYQQQLERESAFLEGRDVDSVHKGRVTKSILSADKSAITPQLVKKTFEKLVKEGTIETESIEEAQRRREKEFEEMKKGLIPAKQGFADESSESE